MGNNLGEQPSNAPLDPNTLGVLKGCQVTFAAQNCGDLVHGAAVWNNGCGVTNGTVDVQVNTSGLYLFSCQVIFSTSGTGTRDVIIWKYGSPNTIVSSDSRPPNDGQFGAFSITTFTDQILVDNTQPSFKVQTSATNGSSQQATVVSGKLTITRIGRVS